MWTFWCARPVVLLYTGRVNVKRVKLVLTSIKANSVRRLFVIHPFPRIADSATLTSRSNAQVASMGTQFKRTSRKAPGLAALEIDATKDTNLGLTTVSSAKLKTLLNVPLTDAMHSANLSIHQSPDLLLLQTPPSTANFMAPSVERPLQSIALYALQVIKRNVQFAISAIHWVKVPARQTLLSKPRKRFQPSLYSEMWLFKWETLWAIQRSITSTWSSTKNQTNFVANRLLQFTKRVWQILKDKLSSWTSS